jgi:hypothetical protein
MRFFPQLRMRSVPENCRQVPDSSRICNGHSTREPHGSTGIGRSAGSLSSPGLDPLNSWVCGDSWKIHQCSRFCRCQSTQESQGSTRERLYALSGSLKSTYVHSVSTESHKRFDLFWEQRIGGSNPSSPTNNSCICYSLSSCQKRHLMCSCSSLGILKLRNRLQIKIPMIFVDRYALDFSIVLEQLSRENHLLPRQMRSRHAEAVSTNTEQSVGISKSQSGRTTRRILASMKWLRLANCQLMGGSPCIIGFE